MLDPESTPPGHVHRWIEISVAEVEFCAMDSNGEPVFIADPDGERILTVGCGDCDVPWTPDLTRA